MDRAIQRINISDEQGATSLARYLERREVPGVLTEKARIKDMVNTGEITELIQREKGEVTQISYRKQDIPWGITGHTKLESERGETMTTGVTLPSQKVVYRGFCLYTTWLDQETSLTMQARVYDEALRGVILVALILEGKNLYYRPELRRPLSRTLRKESELYGIIAGGKYVPDGSRWHDNKMAQQGNPLSYITEKHTELVSRILERS